MEKSLKSLFYLLFLGVTTLLVSSCEKDYSDRLMSNNPEGNAVDVSSRITGFTPETTGAGGVLTVNGSDFSDVFMVRMGDFWINDFEVSESAITFTVPANAAIGENLVTLVYRGPERAAATVEVVPAPNIFYYSKKVVSEGDQVTVLGNNFDYVNEVRIGGTAGNIISKTDGQIVFSVASGTPTGPLSIITTSGSEIATSKDIISCGADPDNYACLPVINTNGSFEDGGLGTEAPGWGISGSLYDAVVTDEERYDGFQSVKMTINEIGPNPWSIQPVSSMQVIPGDTYHLSVWVKGSGISNIKFAIDQGGTPGWAEYGAPEVEINSDEWFEVAYDFVANTDNPEPGNARFAISISYDGNAGGEFYMDNFRVVHLP